MRRVVVFLFVALASLPFPGAAAHEGQGTIEVLGAERAGPDVVRLRVRVTFVEDGHLAAEATVTAVVVDPGSTRPPQTLDKVEDGIYEGPVSFPGTEGQWTVRLTSLRPIASVEQVQTLEPVATTTAQPTTTTTPVSTTTTSDPGSGSSGGGQPAMLAAGAAVVIAAGVLLWRQRRRRSEP